MPSREPSSAAHRMAQAGHSFAVPQPVPEPPITRPKPGKGRRIRVEGLDKPKPSRTETEKRAASKALTTTEALTDYERKIIQGYRLCTSGEAAAKESEPIEIEILSERRARS